MDTGTGLAFGDLLRHRRGAAGLTQEDLAERTGLTTQAISLLERGERRRPQRYTVQKLAEALGLEGRELAGFESAARSPSSRRASEPTRNPLPKPPTPLIGREHEAALASDLLVRQNVRLLTVTGPGGVGKTRLALEVAARVTGDPREAFADGAVFVPLAPLRDPAVVPSALAKALGVSEAAGRSLTETLKEHLRERRILVVLDNFEHLLGAVTVVADLVGSCPGLTVLVTSRAPLNLSGEFQFPVAPLSLSGAGVPSAPADATARSAAVELFCQRATAVVPTFGLTHANTAAVAEVCRRLDGLPLAIELAAARVKLFSPKALLDRLDHRLQVLAGGARDLPERQRTLRDAVAWSYDLLDGDERLLFRRLAVFVGDFSLGAAEAVRGPEADVLGALASLVDNSLLVPLAETSEYWGSDEPRFVMLETIREYAAERLAENGEAGDVHRAHALYFLAVAETTQPEASPRREWWWMRLEEEHDNLRAALRWAIRNREEDAAARFALASWRFWSARHLSEGLRWLEAVLAVGGTVGAEEQARRRAFLLLVAGILATRHGDYDRAVALDEESLALYRELGHRKSTHGPLRELGTVAYYRGNYERAVHLHEQALAVAREFGNVSGSGLAVCNLADALRARGDLERARSLLEESLASLREQEPRLSIKRRLPTINAIVNTLIRLGSLQCETGEDARAASSYAESLRLMWRYVGRAYETASCLEGLARVAAMQGRPERAAWLLGASAVLADEMGTPLTPIARADHDHATATAREALGEEAFEAAWDTGHATPPEESIATALKM